MPAPDIFQEINERRQQVEPYLPLPSEGLSAIHQGHPPTVIELISSQSQRQPSSGFQTHYNAIIQAACPSHQPYQDALKQNRTNTQLHAAQALVRDNPLSVLLEKFDQETSHDKTIADAVAQYRKLRGSLVSYIETRGEEKIPAEMAAMELLRRLHKLPDTKGKKQAKLFGQQLIDVVNLRKMEDLMPAVLLEHFYPTEMTVLTDALQHTQALEKTLDEEVSQDMGFDPPVLLEAVKAHLRTNHNIADLDQGTTHIYNGGSYTTLLAGMGAVVKKGQYILTPELHWDGYNALAGQLNAELLEIPRATDLERFFLEHIEGAVDHDDYVNTIRQTIGCILLTNPCSITGKVYSDEEIGEYLRFAKKYTIPLVVNEVYAAPDHTGKPHASITQHPEFKGAERIAFISGSLSKTFQQLHLAKAKLAYCWTRHEEWAKIAKGWIEEHKHPFSMDTVLFDLAMLRGTPSEYFVENEKYYEAARKQMDTLMQETNQAEGKTLLSWSSEGYPKSGYMAAIQLHPELVAKAGITTPLDLWEYVYKVAGVNAGPVFFSEYTLTDQNPPPMAVRVNYSIAPDELALGMKLLAFAAREMERGVTLADIKDKSGEQRPEYSQHLLMQRMMAEFGGNVQQPQLPEKARG